MILEKIKETIARQLNIDSSDLIYPPNSSMGDLSFPVFKLVKEKKSSIEIIINDIKNEMINNKNLMEVIDKIETSGAYLNFFIKFEYLSSKIIKDILKNNKNYGFNSSGQKNVSIFEFSNVNTHKDFHIGHLRNICFGDSIYKIFQANGFKAYPISYINDFGIHVAKTIWSYKRKNNENLGECYSDAVKSAENDPLLIKEFSSIMSDIEKRQGENYKIWKKTRRISLNNFYKIYKILNIKFKKNYFENEVIDRGLNIVKDFLEKGIFKKSEGAIIADLEKYKLSVLPVIRSDGTALYPVADLALASIKFKDFKKLKNSFIIVDIRQSLYFKQLFKILSLAGYKHNFIHLPYEFVTLPEGMMSSRSGNAITFEDLYKKTVDKLIIESKKRHLDWSSDKINKNSSKLATAILKFEMLKVSANKIIIFDINEATKFDGFNALYVLYSIVRIKSILKKSKFKLNNKFDAKFLNNKLEKEIILKLAKYPELIIKSCKDYDPSEIAKYLFELFKIFNDYYQRVKILQAEDNIKKSRLIFIKSILIVAENALSLLGIESLEEI